MNIAGDGIFIYQGSDSNPYFIFGFNNSSGPVDAFNWNTSASVLLRDSMLPNGAGSQNALTNGVNAVGMPGGGAQQDNVQYTGPTTSANRMTWLDRVTNVANWSGDNTGSVVTSVGTAGGSTVTLPAPNPAPTVDLNGAVGGTSYSASFTENGNAVRMAASDATLSDDDSITGMTLALAATPDGTSETIAYS